MWERRSSTSTRRSSSVAARSATVRPKKPDPTTTRSYPAKLTGPEGSSAGPLHVARRFTGPRRVAGSFTDVFGAALAVVALYVLVLWMPGLVLGRLAGLRGWTLVAAAPLVTYALAGLAGPPFAAAGVALVTGQRRAAGAGVGPGPGRRAVGGHRIGLVVVVVAVVVVVIIIDRGGGARRRRRNRAGPARPTWRVAAALVAIAVFGAGVVWAGIGRLSAIPQDWDAAFHANGIRYIADTGDSSLVGMGSINWFEHGVQVFYPNAYHLVGAIVLRLTGVDVPTVLNAHTVLLPGMGALAIVALVHRFGGRAVLAVAAAACSVAVTSFYDLLWRGPLLPFATGAVLLPLTVVLLLDLLDAGTRPAPGCATGLLFAVGLVGLTCLNPGLLFSAVLFVLPALAQRWITRPALLGRDLVVIAAAGLGAAVLLLPQLRGALSSTGGEPFDWPADLSVRRALFELVSLSHDGRLADTPPSPGPARVGADRRGAARADPHRRARPAALARRVRRAVRAAVRARRQLRRAPG